MAGRVKGLCSRLPHPHVVVQEDVFNRSRNGTIVVCPLRSNLHRPIETGHALLEYGKDGLKKQSVAVESQVSAVYKSRLADQIFAGMRFQHAAFSRR
jgi:mRNA interferase MazF